jgi:hypothetical protein
MLSDSKQKELVRVDRFVTDKKGRKVAAIIDIEELNRIEEILEDSSDLKVIRERVAEPAEDYEVYSRKRRARLRQLRGSIAVELDLTTLRHAKKR